ncbi:MAG: glutamate--tRNA ligase [Gammaproteobacteria bacterium]|nr:glutamate--tRNA ligase [Gammaproteobacteria bacterium]
MTVRTRIAPSPTGDPHVGTAYMALFNWVFAKSQGGEIILRIEDTDAARSSRESEQMIVQALQWLDISWDEGPDVGGDYGPYRQSERKEIYHEHVSRLLDDGNAFYCFCTPDRLDEVRAAQRAAGENPGYDGLCRDLAPDEVTSRIHAGEAHVIRMNVPEEGTCKFSDELRGEIEIPYAQIDMQVLVKSDGYPTYHLAVVVDDHLMEITHILRGEEWINSVPKHKLLFDYFGWDMPVMVHLPLLRNPDQSKLSKRKNPTSINYYRNVGYLPEALLNYLGTMGWSMPDDREIFNKDGMAEVFDFKRISLGGPIFDLEKLSWLNGQYLRALDAESFMDQIQTWAMNRDNLQRLVPLVQERTERLADIFPQVDYLLGDRRALTPDDFEKNKIDTDHVVQILDHLSRSFDELRTCEADELYQSCRTLADHLGLKFRDVLAPVFGAVSGRAVSLPLFDSMVFLGSDITRVRLREALAVLGVSGKQRKRLEKSYRLYEAWLAERKADDS